MPAYYASVCKEIQTSVRVSTQTPASVILQASVSMLIFAGQRPQVSASQVTPAGIFKPRNTCRHLHGRQHPQVSACQTMPAECAQANTWHFVCLVQSLLSVVPYEFIHFTQEWKYLILEICQFGTFYMSSPLSKSSSCKWGRDPPRASSATVSLL